MLHSALIPGSTVIPGGSQKSDEASLTNPRVTININVDDVGDEFDTNESSQPNVLSGTGCPGSPTYIFMTPGQSQPTYNTNTITLPAQPATESVVDIIDIPLNEPVETQNNLYDSYIDAVKAHNEFEVANAEAEKKKDASRQAFAEYMGNAQTERILKQHIAEQSAFNKSLMTELDQLQEGIHLQQSTASGGKKGLADQKTAIRKLEKRFQKELNKLQGQQQQILMNQQRLMGALTQENTMLKQQVNDLTQQLALVQSGSPVFQQEIGPNMFDPTNQSNPFGPQPVAQDVPFQMNQPVQPRQPEFMENPYTNPTNPLLQDPALQQQPIEDQLQGDGFGPGMEPNPFPPEYSEQPQPMIPKTVNEINNILSKSTNPQMILNAMEQVAALGTADEETFQLLGRHALRPVEEQEYPVGSPQRRSVIFLKEAAVWALALMNTSDLMLNKATNELPGLKTKPELGNKSLIELILSDASKMPELKVAALQYLDTVALTRPNNKEIKKLFTKVESDNPRVWMMLENIYYSHFPKMPRQTSSKFKKVIGRKPFKPEGPQGVPTVYDKAPQVAAGSPLATPGGEISSEELEKQLAALLAQPQLQA